MISNDTIGFLNPGHTPNTNYTDSLDTALSTIYIHTSNKPVKI